MNIKPLPCGCSCIEIVDSVPSPLGGALRVFDTYTVKHCPEHAALNVPPPEPARPPLTLEGQLRLTEDHYIFLTIGGTDVAKYVSTHFGATSLVTQHRYRLTLEHIPVDALGPSQPDKS